MSRVIITPTLDFSHSIASCFKGKLYCVTDSVMLAVKELSQSAFEALKAIGSYNNRLELLGDGQIARLKGPLTLWTGPGVAQHAARIAFCLPVAMVAMICFDRMIDSTIADRSSLTFRMLKTARPVFGLLAGVATFYLIGKASGFHINAEFLPPGTTFKTNWLGDPLFIPPAIITP